MNARNLTSRSFKPLLKRTGFPDIRLHDLRHTCATLMLCEGVHIKLVQELLGHDLHNTRHLQSPAPWHGR